jgi:hypothetical protein
MSDHWLHYMNLSDPYERKARFIPGLVTALPLLPLAAAYRLPLSSWVGVLVSGAGLAAAAAVFVSHLASAFGNRLQRELWPDWPHDAPTHRWLWPTNNEVSGQQRALWYERIRALTGLDIAAAASHDSPEETRRVINDAVVALRARLWQAPEGERVRLHNTDFGFARNLTGLRLVWMPLTVLSTIGCWIGFAWVHCPLLWALVATALAVIALPVGWFILPGYVRLKAHQYGESFFGALVLLSVRVPPLQQ